MINMPRTISEMVEKGRRKLQIKAPTMSANWDAAKTRMKTSYGALPFGPSTKAAFGAGVDAGRHRAPDIEKWARNWQAAVTR